MRSYFEAEVSRRDLLLGTAGLISMGVGGILTQNPKESVLESNPTLEGTALAVVGAVAVLKSPFANVDSSESPLSRRNAFRKVGLGLGAVLGGRLIDRLIIRRDRPSSPLYTTPIEVPLTPKPIIPAIEIVINRPLTP